MEKPALLVVLISVISILASADLYAQESVKPRPSPTAIVTMKYEDSYVKVTYCQPHKRGREVFGELVPYGKVWRTGANEATEITATDDVLIQEDTLKAGTYSIFTIPAKDEWTVIFNSELGQWGAYNYRKKSDILRVKVPAQQVKDVIWEPFTISFAQRNDEANLQMMWDQTMVSIPIRFIED